MSDSAHVENVNADLAAAKTTQENEVIATETSTGDMVSREEMNKVMDDMHNFKRLAKDFEDKLKNKEVDDLKEKEEWQKIAQIKEDEANDYKSKAEKLKDSVVWEKKFATLKDHALKAGIRQEALSDLELLDLDNSLAIETTSTGRINVLGADQAINKLKNERPHWFASKGVNINSSNPEVVAGSGKPVMKDIFEAEKKAKETGDYAPYYKLMKLYQTQS